VKGKREKGKKKEKKGYWKKKRKRRGKAASWRRLIAARFHQRQNQKSFFIITKEPSLRAQAAKKEKSRMVKINSNSSFPILLSRSLRA